MRQLIRIIILFGACCAVINGRAAPASQDAVEQSNRVHRSLKGILKNLKEQPRLPDSVELESKEETSANPGPSYSLDISGKEILGHSESAVQSIPNVPESHFLEDPVIFEEAKVKVASNKEEQTTTYPFEAESLGSRNDLSKSDLEVEDLENDDIDTDGCTEGDVMRVSCNTCVCSSGKYFCSKRECHDKDIPLPPRPKANYKRKGSITYHRTKPDEGFRNETADSVEGNQFSNPNVTSTEENSTSVSQFSECIDGRTKPVDCNQCVCALGQWACTKQSCIALSLREKASFSGGDFLSKAETLKESMSMDEDCLEGETKKFGCNQCVCHQNSWACTDFTCPATETPAILPETAESCQTEEDVKSKECNICSCRRGVWVCTINDCKKFGNRYYHPVSQKHTSYEIDD